MNDTPIDYKGQLENLFRLRDLYARDQMDYIKLSSEFSKIVVSNLMLINAGALVAMPAVLQIVHMDRIDDSLRMHVTVYPFVAFTIGIALALLCALVVYYNYQKWARLADTQYSIEGKLFIDLITGSSDNKEIYRQWNEFNEFKHLRFHL